MKPFVLGKHDWDKGTMKKRLNERFYEIQLLGSPYRRNRQHLVKSPTQLEKPNETIPVLEPLSGPQQRPETGLLNTQSVNSQKGHLEAQPTKQSSLVHTHSAHITREHFRFQDYLKT